jgi:membrane protein implicated in regulation of membrane protease activity
MVVFFIWCCCCFFFPLLIYILFVMQLNLLGVCFLPLSSLVSYFWYRLYVQLSTLNKKFTCSFMLTSSYWLYVFICCSLHQYLR